MIDTITLRIHDLSLHADLVRILASKNDPNTGYRRDRFEHDPANDVSPAARQLFGTHITYYDTGKVQTILQQSEFKSSHHYTISNRVDYDRDFVEFSFSIPKYVYGTNIVLFVPHHLSPSFSRDHHSRVRYNLDRSYGWLRDFLNRFFRYEFPECRLVKELTEVNRIDLCYNQVFRTKADSFDYLNQVRKFRKKFSRDTSRMFNYTSSFSYVTDRYSFKVYHKGTEYRRHDRRKHLQINREQNRPVFPVDQLQALSDRILRYEATFRSSFLSYTFDQYLLKPHCEHFQEGKKYFTMLQNHPERRSQLSPQQKYLSKLYKSYVDTKKVFVWKVRKNEREIIEHTPYHLVKQMNLRDLPRITHAPFSEELFGKLADKFYSFLDEFRVLENVTTDDTIKRAEQFNLKVQSNRLADDVTGKKSSKINIPRLRMYLELCKANDYTFADLKHHNIIPKSTYYYYRQQLKNLGLSEKNIHHETINVRFDLSAYHDLIVENNHVFARLGFIH